MLFIFFKLLKPILTLNYSKKATEGPGAEITLKSDNTIKFSQRTIKRIVYFHCYISTCR